VAKLNVSLRKFGKNFSANFLLKKSMVKIYDDWANSVLKVLLENSLYSDKLNWNIPTSGFTTIGGDVESMMKTDSNIVDSWQFVHPLLINGEIESPLFFLVKYFLEHFIELISSRPLEYFSLLRIKANLMPRQIVSGKDIFYNPPHNDILPEYAKNQHPAVLLYYVNDSDGDTFFFDDDYNIIERITPKCGRMVLFDNSVKHASSPPQISKSRMVINSNIFLPHPVKDLV